VDTTAYIRQHSKFLSKHDLSELHPSVRTQARDALYAIDRLQTAFGWALALFGFGAAARATATLK
jgi:hypothetical protein